MVCVRQSSAATVDKHLMKVHSQILKVVKGAKEKHTLKLISESLIVLQCYTTNS